MWQGRPLERWPTPAGKVSYSQIFHWRRCAHWRGLTWEYFSRLPIEAQAAYVAEYETATKLEALEIESARKAAEQRARRITGKSRV